MSYKRGDGRSNEPDDRNPDITAGRNFTFPPASGQYQTLPRGESGGPQLPPRGNVPGDAPFARMQFPPRIEKINGSADFREQDYALVLPAGGQVDGPSFQLPQAQVGWLQQNRIYVLTPTGATDFSMQVLINNGPVPGFDDIRMVPGLANFVVLLENEMRVRIPNNGTVALRFVNRGPAEVVGGMIAGWFHPLSSEERAWGTDGF